MTTRPAAVAGTWYPGSAGALTREVDAHLQQAAEWHDGEIRAIIAPHAGLMFSGPVGACAYKAAATQVYDVVVLVGPSHFVTFDGIAAYPSGSFATPLGEARIDEPAMSSLLASPIVRAMPAAHAREHSLEMQLPFLRRLLPDLPIVPLLMGFQTRETILALGDALASALAGRRPLLIASTDLSHYFDARTAASLDERVQAHIAAFDPEGLLARFEEYPQHERGRYVACGGGAAIAVMMAARSLGARDARVLRYAHSGEISGDYDGVVGYVAAALGTFSANPAFARPAAGRATAGKPSPEPGDPSAGSTSC
jgi:AmmeMemoRadiSam system protein B